MRVELTGVPIVAFLVTVRDQERYIGACINSIKQQSNPSWECVIVDDGSVDDTIEHIKQLICGDDRFELVLSEHVGRGPALNIALHRATAPIITILDSDDVSSPNRVDTIKNNISMLNKFDVITGESIKIRESEDVSWDPKYDSCTAAITDVTDLLRRGNPVCHSAAFMSRHRVIDLGGYSEKRKAQFDLDLWVRIVSAGGRIGKVSSTFVASRRHRGQIFRHHTKATFMFASARLRLKAIKAVGGGSQDYIYLVARLIWAFVSRPCRRISESIAAVYIRLLRMVRD